MKICSILKKFPYTASVGGDGLRSLQPGPLLVGLHSLVKSLSSPPLLHEAFENTTSTFVKEILGAPFPTSSRMGDKTLSKTSAEAITAGGIPV